ncbi:FBD-associated F-box protein [Rhynchospora pubera]|uniref:FBD-associated F-box protein n=1 Tax=Rhynchospora pubera TaxID=906938 RepID=A0AAV8GXC8_9POAL|nr:FBD-associated F-box protein [Rhynchospora pubera]
MLDILGPVPTKCSSKFPFEQSTMKRAGKSRRDERDRLSSLPDCLIHLIMSFLTTQQAVQTCVLSKRWNNLWTTLPSLDFDLWKFKFDEELDDSETEDSEPRRRFEKFRDFVSTTLLLREASDLHKFRLFCKMFDRHNYRILMRSWILYALKHNLQVLDIDIRPEDSLPFGVFTCASLVDVSLSSYTSVQTVEVINLPCLRRLHLNHMKLNQDFIEKLFCGCPVLEFLHLEYYIGEFTAINSPSLKYLEIKYYGLRGETEKNIELINTPNLLSFRYSIYSNTIGHKILLKMPSLTSASIYSDYHIGKSNILIGLSNVQNLKLRGCAIKGLLKNELPNCPEFSNVKDLSLDDLCLSCNFSLFASFLNHFPNLEKLSLQHAGCSFGEKVDGNRESLKIAPFKGRRLETVEVMFVRNDKCFPQAVKHLQDITEKSKAQINMISVYDWDEDCSEETSQEIN